MMYLKWERVSHQAFVDWIVSREGQAVIADFGKGAVWAIAVRAGGADAPPVMLQREESSCQPGAVHTWLIGDIHNCAKDVRFLG